MSILCCLYTNRISHHLYEIDVSEESDKSECNIGLNKCMVYMENTLQRYIRSYCALVVLQLVSQFLFACDVSGL